MKNKQEFCNESKKHSYHYLYAELISQRSNNFLEIRLARVCINCLNAYLQKPEKYALPSLEHYITFLETLPDINPETKSLWETHSKKSIDTIISQIKAQCKYQEKFLKKFPYSADFHEKHIEHKKIQHRNNKKNLKNPPQNHIQPFPQYSFSKNTNYLMKSIQEDNFSHFITE